MLQIDLKANRNKSWHTLKDMKDTNQIVKILGNIENGEDKNLQIWLDSSENDIDLSFLLDIDYLTGFRNAKRRNDKLQNLDSLIKHKNSLVYLEVYEKNSESIISQFTKIQTLRTAYFKNLDYSYYLTSVENLSLTLSDFKEINFLEFKNLKNLNFGNKCHNVEESNLRELETLKGLSISEIKQLTNLDFIKSFSNLEALNLNYLNNVRSLPDLSNLEKLSTVFIQYMSKLEDFSGLYNANSLENLFLFCSKLEVEKALPFLKLPNLSKGGIGNSKYSDNIKLSKSFEHLGSFPNEYLIE